VSSDFEKWIEANAVPESLPKPKWLTISRLSEASKIYRHNKAAAVGTALTCPSCLMPFTKNSYQQAFCRRHGRGSKEGKGTMCKELYWNTIQQVRK
jgi:hypothetical protein